MPYSNDELISGLLRGDEKILKHFYKKNFPRVSHFISKNGGSAEDASDAFSDGLMILYSKLKTPGFELSCAPGTFLFSVCRLVWMNMQKKEKRMVALSEAYSDSMGLTGSDLYELFIEEEKNKLFYQHLAGLEDTCRNILEMFFRKVPLKEIAVRVGLPDENAAKKRKFLCKKKLLEKIKQDPRYAELTDLF